ncbi:MAG: UxaA family hydrolase [Oscillospiraceae bacterium]|nr:UxaA family hydrolase [Oscillospiraceae bacterium]
MNENENEIRQTFYVVNQNDNVATALGDVAPGEAKLIGAVTGLIEATESIGYGHKIALKDIAKGDFIVKYNANVAKATKDIKKGGYVHIHNAASLNDVRSATYDVDTAVPNDRVYVLD